MCRQELATREHILDQGQLGAASPASAYAFSPAASRCRSMHDNHPLDLLRSQPPSRRLPTHERPLGPLSPLTSSSTSLAISRRTSMNDSGTRPRMGSAADTRLLKSFLPTLESVTELKQDLSDLSDLLSESALEDDTPNKQDKDANASTGGKQPRPAAPQSPISATPPLIARRLSSSGGLAHPSDLAAQLHSNPKLAVLCQPAIPGIAAVTPPILANTRCSGYFVTLMKWIELFLEG
ncbi:hypothetical protein OBBRIDRAFT_888564 [Obba rivulosa]|uniref:Uncharacterized protein n=1 Tax=Obba rivulosa TaxID=1052685 RepID=A0A8E2ARX1_9APHY|nr:hypothetical protein OBBRIDRAFT_888564 [Obba rivulosa]